MNDILKCPWPYFGGKRRVAPVIWSYLGDVANYVEPFCGSAAVLLARPHPPRIETLNDADCFVANFWRATAADPEAVAIHADGPVNECDLHARHRWLVTSPAAADFRARMRADPDYFDAKVAGWWCWGLCCWIGSGWCQTEASAGWEQVPLLRGDSGAAGQGIHASSLNKRPILAAPANEHGERTHVGLGVHAKGPSEQLPKLAGGGKKTATTSYGGSHVHADKIPDLSDAHRPQLADAYSRGRGVHGHDEAGTCEARRAWLVDWFGRLRDRLRTVRVCCGDWRRVCGSPSVTTRLGVTGIFLDPPYSAEAGRAMDLYGVDCGKVAHEVRAYCLEHGGDPLMRLVLAGYEGEGHEELERVGWRVVAWQASGGYGGRTARGKANAKRERLWVSPHCPDPGRESQPLFAHLEDDEP